jgi:perosamine synthetase
MSFNPLQHLIIEYNSSVKNGLEIIDRNAKGICFVVKNNLLVGIATDGDIRRFLLKGGQLEQPIELAMNKEYQCLPVSSSDNEIRNALSLKLKMIPLIDNKGYIVDVADMSRLHKIPVLEPDLSGKELEYVQDCIQTSWISSQGKYVSKFEAMMEDLHPGTRAVSVSNGTTALHLALVVLGVNGGDEVILPNLTFAACANAVIYCGATPVFCDVEESTWCIDIQEAEKLITKRTKAIMPVHLYGQMSNMDGIKAVSEKYNLKIIEDCAEALGSKWNNVPAGTFGDVATFSFFGNKTITTGEGGMVLFRDQRNAERARTLRDHGMSKEKRYWHDQVGFNYRLTNLQAAVGVAQLERFDKILAKKIEIGNLYSKYFENATGVMHIPKRLEGVKNSNWLYTILIDPRLNRDKLIERLKYFGIETRPVFYPLNEMPPYKNFPRSKNLNVSQKVSKSGISLPTSITLGAEEIESISQTVKDVLREMLKEAS